MSILKDLEEFLYFDERMIDYLSNQISLSRLESYSEENTQSKDKSINVRPKFGLSFLSTLMSPLKLDIESDGGYKRTGSNKSAKNFVLTREARYSSIIGYLGGYSKIKQSLDQAWLKSLEHGSSFCILEDEFKPAYKTSEWVKICNESKFLQLEDTNRGSYKIGMGFDKIFDVRNDRIERGSHLEIRLRCGHKLRVFGKMDKTRYIKPFVVSWK